jgi:hypothetical protein
MCVAIPVVSQRWYEDRLHALVPGNWSTTAPSLVVAQDRLVIAAQVQIGSLTHTDYAERPFQVSTALTELENIAPDAQAAFERAFVGACARFGLGRYLTDLARELVPYDPERRAIALSPKAQLDHVQKLYQQAGILIQPSVELSHSASTLDLAARLRERDLAWIREQCNAGVLKRICLHYQVACLEELSDIQLASAINAIHAHQHAS